MKTELAPQVSWGGDGRAHFYERGPWPEARGRQRPLSLDENAPPRVKNEVLSERRRALARRLIHPPPSMKRASTPVTDEVRSEGALATGGGSIPSTLRRRGATSFRQRGPGVPSLQGLKGCTEGKVDSVQRPQHKTPRAGEERRGIEGPMIRGPEQ